MSADQLAAFRKGGAKAAKPKRVEWAEPTLDDFPTDAAVIGADQSLGATGMVWLSMREGCLEVLGAKVFKGTCADDLTGWERDLQLGESLRQLFLVELRNYYPSRDWTLYNEAPPVGGGKIVKPESSLLASAALVAACADAGLPRGRMIRSQDWKRITMNVPNAKKAEILSLLPPLARRLECGGLNLVTNEATRDALGVALASMIREHRAGS